MGTWRRVVGAVALAAALASAAGQSAAATASAKNTEAMEIAGRGNLRDALALFKEALALEPGAVNYMNNVGVTLMRMGRLAEAKAMFVRALRVDPDTLEARDNLVDLAKFMGDDPDAELAKARARVGDPEAETDPDFAPAAPPPPPPPPTTRGPGPLRHRVRRLPRIHVSRLYEPAHVAFATGREPFVLTGALDAWNRAPFALDALDAAFGNATVDFYPSNLRREGTHPFITPLRTALAELRRPTGAFPRDPAHPGAYVQWNTRASEWRRLSGAFGPLPPLLQSDDGWLEGCLPNEALRNEFGLSTHWRMLLVGSAGAGMFNHKDTLRTASFQLQLIGAKKWHLCSPDMSALIERGGSVETNLFAPDYAQRPWLQGLDCVLDTVAEGEVLFYPMDYWHQTENLRTPTVAVTGTLVDAHNWHAVAHQLHVNCRKRPKRRLIDPSEALCKYLFAHCFPWWRAAFGDAEANLVHLPSADAFNASTPTSLRPAGPELAAVAVATALEPTNVPGEFACRRAPPFAAAERVGDETREFYGNDS
jgi:tetratricopeptide (TPR) repeat protein